MRLYQSICCEQVTPELWTPELSPQKLMFNHHDKTFPTTHLTGKSAQCTEKSHEAGMCRVACFHVPTSRATSPSGQCQIATGVANSRRRCHGIANAWTPQNEKMAMANTWTPRTPGLRTRMVIAEPRAHLAANTWTPELRDSMPEPNTVDGTRVCACTYTHDNDDDGDKEAKTRHTNTTCLSFGQN